LNKAVFRSLVLDDYYIAEEIDRFKANDSNKKILLHILLRLEKELPESDIEVPSIPVPYTLEPYSYDSESSYSSDYSSDDAVGFDDPVQQMSVDELMIYINGR
jgi:hypothetical protein